MSSSKKANTEIPTPEIFLIGTPLYTSFKIDSSNYKDVLRIEFFQGTLDTYCIECGRDSVFNSKALMPEVGNVHSRRPKDVEDLLKTFYEAWLPLKDYSDSQLLKQFSGGEAQELRKVELKSYATSDRNFSLRFECTRVATHTLHFLFRVQDDKITKIGQYPSSADLQNVEIKKYRKILGDSKYRELHRAVGLNAHGVGIGAFVYLRRIFEGQIEIAHAEAVNRADWNEETYKKSRMDEKILILKGWLPEILVQNRVIYSILSKGLHTLTEEECLEHFGALRHAIELILNEKIKQQEKAQKTAQIKKDIASIKDKLR